MSNFHPPEVVCRGSETQLQVSENLNKITWREKGKVVMHNLPSWRGAILPAVRDYGHVDCTSFKSFTELIHHCFDKLGDDFPVATSNTARRIEHEDQKEITWSIRNRL